MIYLVALIMGIARLNGEGRRFRGGPGRGEGRKKYRGEGRQAPRQVQGKGETEKKQTEKKKKRSDKQSWTEQISFLEFFYFKK